MSATLAIYHSLPPSLRSLAASLRGAQLNSIRYGTDSERWIEQAHEREYWSAQRWAEWQRTRLDFILDRARTSVPFYRDFWRQWPGADAAQASRDLHNWPVLEKESLRKHPERFVADDVDPRALVKDHTSGTTGTPLSLSFSRETVRQWYALFDARTRRWHGVKPGSHWAILGGQLVVPIETRRPPFWVWNAAMNQLYMSSYHLSPELIPTYLEAIEEHRITYLIGYTSSLYALAEYANRIGKTFSLRTVISNAEPVYDYQRRAICAAFGCPLRETYGMSELVAAASECEHGTLHLFPENGLVEVLQGTQPVAPGLVGDLVCTGLLNLDMPLIRYRVGDRGRLPLESPSCSCGRTLPVLASVEGRCDDVLILPDGRKIGRLDPVFKTGMPIREAQVAQERPNVFILRFVPNSPADVTVGTRLAERLRERLGPDVEIHAIPVNEIPREPNGKFRAVVNRIAKTPDSQNAF